MKTPVHNYSVTVNGAAVSIKIKRDDLYSSEIGSGGSKSRKADLILPDIVKAGYNAIVTNGGVHSNHARAIALKAASMKVRCHLVIHHDSDEKPCGDNLKMMQLSGATMEFCQIADLASAMDHAMERLETEQFKPFYCWGGGHCPMGTAAYVNAAEEFLLQSSDWIPDYVFVPSGTGTTQAGLIYGFRNYHTQVVGISIARPKMRGEKVVSEALADYCRSLSLSVPELFVDFRDNWIFGGSRECMCTGVGYECYDHHITEIILQEAKKGLLLDPTYTAKAFYGMLQMIKSGEVSSDSKILFWHTGGLFNLLSSNIEI